MFNNANTPGMILEQLGHDHPSLEGPTKLQTELCLGTSLPSSGGPEPLTD